MHGTRAALAHMVPRHAGTIVHIGSALAYRSIPLQASYCMAKAAVRGFGDSLRSERRHDDSRVQLSMVQLSAATRRRPTGRAWTSRASSKRFRRSTRPTRSPGTSTAPRTTRRASSGSARKAIIGNIIVRGWIDGDRSRHGYRGEMTSQRANRERLDDLYEPVDTDPGANERSHRRASRGGRPRVDRR